MYHRRNTLVVLLLAVITAAPQCVNANTVLAPDAPNTVSLFNLGTVPSVAAQYSNQIFYEGLAIAGNTLLLSVGDPGTVNQKVWSVPLVRANNHIVSLGSVSPTDFTGVPSYPGDCCFGNVMAGGLVVANGAGDLLYTTQTNSYLGQHTGGKPGSSALLDLASTGAATGGLNYVPGSFTQNGAGQLKMTSACEPGSGGCSAQGDWYTLNLGGSIGSYTLNSFTAYTVGVAAFSFDYVPVDATFSAAGVILGDAILQRLDYYQVDSNGNPCNPTVNVSCGPVIHLVTSDVQIGLGVVRDPISGDFLFTSGDNQVWLMSDSLPEPSTWAMVLGGIAAAAALKRRRILPSFKPRGLNS